MKNSIIILDYGSQYTQLIARKIRELKVHSIILPYDYNSEKIKQYNVKGIVLSGGPSSVYEKDAPFLNKDIFSYGVPIFGICYGFQLLVKHFNGIVESSKKAEYGSSNIIFKSESNLFNKIQTNNTVWMSHGDKVSKVPSDWSITSESENKIISSAENNNDKIYGVQFHPEVMHTDNGKQFIHNFLFDICKANPDWTASEFITQQIISIKETVKDDNVICALSGGVDSTVVACLLKKALGSKVKCVFVDHGLLRKNEAEEVIHMYNTYLNLDVTLLNKSSEFLNALDGIKEPEKKRKIIGNKFIEEFEKFSSKLNNFKFLAQGTLYPDVIESGGYGKVADKIKSHHNVGGLPEEMKFKLIEPVNELFKDEVRSIGVELGIPKDFIGRHPFPGPGLGIRIMGEITNERLDILKNADDIFIRILKDSGYYDKIWQAFCVLLPVKTVGVMGDKRTYAWPIVLRCVSSEDGMTADWSKIPNQVLEKISNRIVNEVKQVNRVVFDITSKPPGTIEWE